MRTSIMKVRTTILVLLEYQEKGEYNSFNEKKAKYFHTRFCL